MKFKVIKDGVIHYRTCRVGEIRELPADIAAKYPDYLKVIEPEKANAKTKPKTAEEEV